jgi:hypothetical protein
LLIHRFTLKLKVDKGIGDTIAFELGTSFPLVSGLRLSAETGGQRKERDARSAGAKVRFDDQNAPFAQGILEEWEYEKESHRPPPTSVAYLCRLYFIYARLKTMATRRRKVSKAYSSVVQHGASWIMAFVVASSLALSIATIAVEAKPRHSSEANGWKNRINPRAFEMRDNRR